jgi:acetyl-CoA synthetase (ADP-forming)
MDKALLEHEAKQLLRDFQIPVLAFEFCQTEEEVVRAASSMGFPVVLKIVSPQIVHKSEAGGVKLNIRNEEELNRAYAEMMASARNYDAQAEISGVLVSPFMTGAKELIVGSVEDPQFGPVVMVGLGGIFVEIFKDVSFGIAPLDMEEATEMLENLKAYPILEGTRGQQGLPVGEIASLIVNVSRLISEQPILELDLNPVFCFPDQVLVADARVLLK